MRILIIAVAMALFSGCASSGNSSFHVNSANFERADAQNLCAVYGYRWNRYIDAREELEARQKFTDEEWRMIDRRELAPGMSECAMKAAFAIDYEKIETLEYEDGAVEQIFYYGCGDGRTPYCPYSRVVVRDGQVVSIEKVEEI